MLQTHCKCAAIICKFLCFLFCLDGPPVHIMMFTAKEIGKKIERHLTDPKYNEILLVDDDKATKKRGEKKKEKEKLAQRDKDREEVTYGPRKKKQKIESKKLF